MLLVATRVLQTKEGIEVSISSQVDMKTNLKADMVKNRGFTEIRKYLDKIHNHLQAYGSKSIIWLFVSLSIVCFDNRPTIFNIADIFDASETLVVQNLW